MLFKALGIIEIEIDATMESGEARSLQKTSLFGSLDVRFTSLHQSRYTSTCIFTKCKARWQLQMSRQGATDG